MKALIFRSSGNLKDVLQLEEVASPQPGHSQAVIKVKARPVNPSDIFFIQGVYRHKPVFPQIAGLEGSGVVVQTGSEVKQVSVGDHVAFRAPGTWAEEIAVEEAELIRIDAPLPYEISAQIGLNGLTAYALLEQSQLREGDFLLLDAATGSLANLIIQLAVSKGIRVVAMARSLSEKDRLLAIGAEHVLKQDDPDLSAKIEEAIGNKRINCFIDTVGGSILTLVLDLMAISGVILICGNMSKGAPAYFTNRQLSYGLLTIKGFGIDDWIARQAPEVIKKAYSSLANDISEGKIIMKPFLTIPIENLKYTDITTQKAILTTQ